MRNLKRALSLTLASVMLLGMMVVGGSAAEGYPDVSEEENIEAIEVLQAVGVMGGDNNGNFNPDDYVTREQMAVIMSQLLKLDYNYYKGTNPFSDVPEWAAPYVAACAANGITAGIGDGLYGSKQNIQAVQAALMMLKALGYFQYAGDYEGGYVLATVKQASEVGLFDGIDSDSNADLTRNQIAQMVLNALQADMVSFTGDPGVTYTGSNGESWVGGYKAEYTPRTSTQSKYQAIERRSSDVSGDANHRGQYYIQLGEELYNGELKLNDRTIDAFGRPSRYWEYKGNEIGTYAKKELLVESYNVSVKGREAYEKLGATAIDTKDLLVYVDGAWYETLPDSLKINRTDLVRSNNKNLNSTGRGVVTEFYVDNVYNEITIAVINNYLAGAQSDYNTNTEDIRLDVYYGVEKGSNNTPDIQVYPVTVEVEDYAMVENMEAEDLVRITMAAPNHTYSATCTDYTIESMDEPDVVSDVTLSDYSVGDYIYTDSTVRQLSNVTADGTRYNAAKKAFHDEELFFQYSGEVESQLRDATYNLFLDQFGNILGIEQVSKEDHYIFVASYEVGSTVLAQTVDKALIIHTDGKMETVEIDDSELEVWNGTNWVDADGEQLTGVNKAVVNAWFTYSVKKDGTYVLERMVDRQGVQNRSNDTISIPNGDSERTYIDAKHGSVTTAAAPDYLDTGHEIAAATAYGNDNSVYIAVEANEKWNAGGSIVKVRGTTTGVRDASIRPDDISGLSGIDYNTYFIYNSRGFVTYAVVIGTDGSAGYKYIYLNSSITRTTDDQDNDRYLYTFEGIMDGQLTTFQSTENKAYTSTANGGTITVGGSVGTPGEGDLIRAEIDKDGLVTKMVKLPTTKSGEMYPGLNEDYGYTFKKDANPRVSGTDDITRLESKGRNLYVIGPVTEDNYTVIDDPVAVFVRNKPNSGSDFTVYSIADRAASAVNSLVTTGQATIEAVATMNTAVSGYAHTVVIELDWGTSTPTTPSGSAAGQGPGTIWNTSTKKVEIRYYKTEPGLDEIRAEVEKLLGSPVAKMNTTTGDVELENGWTYKVATIEVVKVNLDGKVAKWVDVAATGETPKNLGNITVPISNGKYLQNVRYSANGSTGVITASGTSLTVTGTSATQTDVDVWTGYTVSIQSTQVDLSVKDGATTVSIDNGGVIAKNESVTVAGKNTSTNYRQFTVDGEPYGKPAQGTSGTVSTMTYAVTKNTTFGESVGYKVMVGDQDLGVHADGATVTITGYGTGTRFASAKVLNGKSHAGSAITKTETVAGFTYTVNQGTDADNGIIELVPVVEVTLAGVTAKYSNGAETVNTGEFVKVGTVLALEAGSNGAGNIKLNATDVEGGTAGDASNKASASYTVKTTDLGKTLAFTVG